MNERRNCRYAPPDLPTTVWLAPQPDSAPAEPTHPVPPMGTVLPPWTIERIRREFATTPSPVSLIHTLVTDTEPGMDARARCTTTGNPDAQASTVLLAELHPDTLPTSDPITQHPAPVEEAWPGFFHRAHRLLRHRGILLLATRQRRETGHLTDPLGALTACARTAGFTYRQHIVIVHGHPNDTGITVTPPDSATPELIHSDLLVFTPSTTPVNPRGHTNDERTW